MCTNIRGIRPRESANREFLEGSWFSEDDCYNHTKSNVLHALDFYSVFVNKESENHQRLFLHDNIRDWEVLE